MKKSLLFLFLLCIGAYSQNVTVVFLGILPGGAPEFEKKFSDLLREQITVVPEVTIADYDETRRLKKRTDFNNSPVLTRSFIEKLMLVASEKTLVVWGDIADFSIKPVRRWLIGAEAVGNITISLTMYSLDFREVAFIGDLSCETRIPKSPVFFRSVDKVTHITAADRTAIIKELQKQAVRKSTDLIKSVVVSQLIKTGSIRPEVKEKKVPSVSDLFDIPTVEAPDVGEEKEEESELLQVEEPDQKSEEVEETEEAEEGKETEEEKEE